VKLSEPFAVDTEFLIQYFGIPAEISSHSLGGSLAYVHFRSEKSNYTYSFQIGDWTGTYGSNSVELQLLLLILHIKRNNDS
jgi:hypothetical protein